MWQKLLDLWDSLIIAWRKHTAKDFISLDDLVGGHDDLYLTTTSAMSALNEEDK